ncbi:MAG TPA: 1-deoxy-D-xylulose-5-phosphate reductoisomerase [Candidatus Nanopelagicaceae bacterium]|nr:1-deoxy-D-xylulose-5-phosphate reductoisomerase [Candidatus Nanopelagicaceae bacterium]
MRSRVVLIGATGSIGRQALDVIARFPEEFELVGAVVGHRAEVLVEALAPYPSAQAVVVAPEGPVPSGMAVGVGAACELASMPGADVIVVGGGGASALLPTLAACEAGHLVAVATKEVLVMAGELVTRTAHDHGARIIPVDSEHSAIWQCLRGEDPQSVARLILTASGGPFRTTPLEQMARATPAQALAHPNWRMGPKVTIDSATMMNKGLEVIEAHFLFEVPYSQIEVVIHPQSAIHSAVEFWDGTIIAQLGVPDMRGPIALAMADGRRLRGVLPPLSLAQVGRLDFERADLTRFPALRVAREAGMRGGALPAAMNAANEVSVAAFLDGSIQFGDIPSLVESVVRAFVPPAELDLRAVLNADRWAREAALAAVTELAPNRLVSPPAVAR